MQTVNRLNDPSMRMKALEARKQAKLTRDASTLRRDFADAAQWEILAHDNHVRLPPWGQPLTPSRIHSFLHRLGVSLSEYREWVGFKRDEQFLAANPQWPARAWAGCLLERFGVRVAAGVER